MIKPSEHTPQTSQLLADLAKELFDARVFAVGYACLAFIPLVFGALESVRITSQNRTAA